MPDDIEFHIEFKKIGMHYSHSSHSTIPKDYTTDTNTGTGLYDMPESYIDTPLVSDSDSLAIAPDDSVHDVIIPTTFAPDRSHQRILFIGDSMLEGLSLRLNDYAAQDDNYLMTVVWYASGTRHWGGTDSLSMLIKRYKPTYIFISCGGNELRSRDVEGLKPYIKNIVNTMGDIPFVWIGPPNWREDTGINDAIREIVGEGRYFDSKHLELQRKSDHIHPTDVAAAYWMDSIARWTCSPQNAHPIQMTYPTVKAQKRNLRVFKRATNI